MKRSIAIKVVKFTAAVTAVAFVGCLCANAPIFAVFLALVGYVIVVFVASNVSPSRSKRQRNLAANNARNKFLKKHCRNIESFDTNEVLIGSSAWVIANDLTSAFQTNGHVSFNDSLKNFDHDAFASNFSTGFNSSSYSIIDHVHGGTDSTGMGGMGGHNDQGLGTDSHSLMSDSSFSATSHDSFSSSSPDPFA
jgi:hypothetical protein